MSDILLSFGRELLFSIVVTVLISRIWLYFTHKSFSTIYFVNSSPSIGKLKLHHYMYGIVIIVLGGLLKNPYLLGIGLGLFVDEFPLIIRYGNRFHWKEYWSWYSFVGVGILLTLVFF